MRAYDIAESAKREITDLTGMKADSVSSIRKDGDVWVVQVEVIELSMTPNSQDILGVYEMTLDDEIGGLIGYSRIERYRRSQVGITRE